MQRLNAVFVLQLPLTLGTRKRFASKFWPDHIDPSSFVIKMIPWEGQFKHYLLCDIARNKLSQSNLMSMLHTPKIAATLAGNFKYTATPGYLRLKFDHIWVWVLHNRARLIMYRGRDGNTFYILNYFSVHEHELYAQRLNHLNTLFANTSNGMEIYAQLLNNNVWTFNHYW